MSKKCQPYWLPNILRILKTEAQVDEKGLESPQGYVNLANGVLGIKDNIIEDHSKKYFFKYVTPISYDPEAQCPQFMKYLHETFEGDKDLIEATFQAYGYCLMGGEPFLHKAFFLSGAGRNGKSVWLHILRHLLGLENVSTVSISLLDRPFSVIQMDGKLANIVGEIPTGKKLDADLFKTAVGGEYLTAAYKGKDEFGLKINTRLVFAGNNLPVFGDTSSGMWEKLYIIPFDRYLEESERDPEIFNRLETELPGILNYSIWAAQGLLKSKKLVRCERVVRAVQEYREETDSVYDFWSEHVGILDDGMDKTYLKTLYNYYVEFCQENSKKALGRKHFSKRMQRIIKELGKCRNYIEFKRDANGHFFCGIELKNVRRGIGVVM